MSSIVSPYDPPPTIHSVLFKSPPETVPPTDELEALHTELTLLKQRTLERARKAGEDLKTIEESMRRLKEREKGKAKAVEKVKRERGCAYLLYLTKYYCAECFGFEPFILPLRHSADSWYPARCSRVCAWCSGPTPTYTLIGHSFPCLPPGLLCHLDVPWPLGPLNDLSLEPVCSHTSS
ncbi:hypothetical protein BKA93DRAFT_524277 [Sparassis latifolia]